MIIAFAPFPLGFADSFCTDGWKYAGASFQPEKSLAELRHWRNEIQIIFAGNHVSGKIPLAQRKKSLLNPAKRFKSEKRQPVPG
jgi:hypothetical protein